MNVVLLLINVALVYGTFLLSYWIRYGQEIPRESLAPFIDSRFFLVGIMAAALTYAGVLRRRFRSYWQVLQKVCFGIMLGTAGCFIFIYLWRERWMRFPSSVLIINSILSTILLFAVDSFILRLKGKIQKRVVILGPAPFFDAFGKKESLVRRKYINSIEELINMRDVDEVMICKRLHDITNLNLLIFLLLKLNVVVTFSPSLYAEFVAGKVDGAETLALVSTFIGRKHDSEEFLIRALDIVGSVVLLIVFSPVLLLTACLIKATSRGPVIYSQQRVGKDRMLFTLYKFRTMFHDAAVPDDHRPAIQNDGRFTAVGRVIRPLRIDELPQLVNVLKGQMSLVGPRPENITRVNMHKALRGLRLAVKPGLTGLAQVRSYYDLNPRHKIKYDYLYVQRRSLMLNIYILAKTVPVVLNARGR